MSLSFEIMTPVYVDLRCMWGKLQVLHWALGLTHRTAAERHVAAFAFTEGGRCARGLPPMDGSAGPLPAVDDEGAEAEGCADDDAAAEPAGDEGTPAGSPRLAEAAGEQGRRMTAVQKGAECSTRVMLDAVSGAAKEVARDLVNTWAAFDRFCGTRLGVTAEQMLAAWEFPARELRDTLERYKALRPDPERVDELLGYIGASWDGRFGEGEGHGHGR